MFFTSCIPLIYRGLFLLCVQLLLSVALFPAHVRAELPSQTEAIAHAFFPKLTRIGELQSAPDVIPVYQLDQLLGYLFETNDLTHLPGFSGERINLMIGMDAQGRFVGLQVINHHEPIFMHGLGEGPMHQFVGQYQGNSVADRIIVDGRYVGQESADGTVYIDGVTKATVSVLVINDTVQAAAMAVARSKLEGFAQSAPAIAKTELFEDLNWQQLTEQGLVRHWTLQTETVSQAMPLSIDLYSDFELLEAAEMSEFSSIYYAYLNVPTVGRNLLGDQEYERLLTVLRPGEHALLVARNAGYPFVSPEFRRGTVPGRLGLKQNGLPIDIRDLDFVEEQTRIRSDTLALNDFHIFRIKAQSGFDPSKPMELQLNLDLARNHLIRDQLSFTDSHQLPEIYFEKVEQNEVAEQPLWVRLWLSRSVEIAGLLTLLVVVTLAFIYQHRLSAKAALFYRLRWGVMLLTLFFIGIYAQGQLSVVNIYTLLLALVDGFDIRVFLLDPILFILWSYVFVTLFIWGRGVFCGWLCPFGVMQELLSALANKLKIRQWKVAPRWHLRLQKAKYLILAGLVGCAFYSLSLAEQLAEVEPFKTAVTLVFVRSWPFLLYAVLILGLGLFIHKFFCRYLCPLGAGLAVLGRFSMFHWLHRRVECGSPCQLCKVRCEIDSIKRDGSIDYDECIQCMECIVILNNEDRCAIEMSQKKRQQKQAQRLNTVEID